MDGNVSTWAGGGTTIGVQSVGDYVDAGDTAARFYTPCELSIDAANNIFVADAYNHRIRKIDPDRMVTTVAGSGESGPDAGGFQNGQADQALFKVPTACHVSLTGSIYVGDGQNQRVRKITPDGMVTTFAGSGETGFENGPDSLATFDFPRGCVMDYQAHRLYVVDYNNHAVRIIHVSEISGMNKKDIKTVFSIYPNPASNLIQLKGLKDLPDFSVQIFDALGKIVKKEAEYLNPPYMLDISDMQQGIYFVRLFHKQTFLGMEKLVVIQD